MKGGILNEFKKIFPTKGLTNELINELPKALDKIDDKTKSLKEMKDKFKATARKGLDTAENKFNKAYDTAKDEAKKVSNTMNETYTYLTKDSKKPVNILKLSIYLSGWLFSIIVLYTYWLKMDTQLAYNISVKLANSVDVNNALMNVKLATIKLKESNANEIENKKELYGAIIELLELQSKCNLLRFNEESIPFPTTEIILTLFLIFLCCSVIISQNLLNNPFEAFRKLKMIKNAQEKKSYISNRTQVYDLIKSLIKDALNAKIDRIKRLIELYSDDEDKIIYLKNKRSSVQEKLGSLQIDNYSNDAFQKIEKEYKNAKSIIENIHSKYMKYSEETNDGSMNEKNVLYNTIDEIDYIHDEYKNAMNKLKQKDLIEQSPQSGGNPMMMDPYGMNGMNMMNQAMIDSMEDDYKLESMKEMIKYTEEEEDMLNELKQLDNSIVDLNSSFTNITVAFTVIAFSVFVSYKLLNNTLSFKSELFNGKLFGEGICYK